MKKNIKKIIITLVMFLSLSCHINTVAADPHTVSVPTATGGATKSGASPTTSITSPLGNIGDKPELIIGTIINGIMGIVGSLALLMFVYGGITWMLAAGESGRVQKGKDILTWATIGLIVIFASYGLVKFVIDVIAGGNIA